MATNWKLASPAQIERRNKRRRETYKKLDSEDKARLAKSKASSRSQMSVEQKEAELSKQRTRQRTDPASQTTSPMLARMQARQSKWVKATAELQQWREAGGGFPWPNLQKKAHVTNLWVQIAHQLGRICRNCGTTTEFDFSWRLTRKDDFLAFVPFQKKAYEQVLKNPDNYIIACVVCSFNKRINSFASLFSPRDGKLAGISGTDDSILKDRVRRGDIRSLTFGIRNSHGQFIPTFIRKNQFHGWVGLQPRDFSWHVMVQAREFYTRLNPSYNCDYWGIGRFENESNLTVEKCGWDALDETTKRILQETPPGCPQQPKSLSVG